MARFNDILNSFSSGEVTPRLYGRTDSDLYRKGAKDITNMYPIQQGGLRRRMGTQLVLSDSEMTSADEYNFLPTVLDIEYRRVISFVISDTERYLILFSVDSANAINIKFYNPDNDYLAIVQNLLFGYSTIKLAFINQEIFSTDASIQGIQYSQSGDVMFFSHPESTPFYIARLSENNLVVRQAYVSTRDIDNSVDNLAMVLAHPVKDMNITTATMIAGAVAGNGITLVCSVDIFDSSYVGSVWAFQNASVVGYAVLVTVVDAKNATMDIFQNLDAVWTTGSTQWFEPAWRLTNYPRSVVAHNGSLYFGGTNEEPNKIWKSEDFDLFEFMNDRTIDPGATILASDPVSHYLRSQSSNKINWMLSHNNDILVGTSGGEFSIRSFVGTELPDIRPQSTFGTENIPPVVIEGSPLFVQKGGKKIRDLRFDFNI
ncbi:MAG: hypothetical protein DRR06_18170, partial [Gammaproteobacteria bacterium]